MRAVKKALTERLPITWSPWVLAAACFLLLLGLSVLMENVFLRLVLAAGTVVAAITFIYYQIKETRTAMERRVREYATLNEISLALRTTLDLDNLLTIIQQQVTRLLGVDNFYVALLDEAEGRIWFPLAVRHSQRLQWQPRPAQPDQLTDRVILNGEPLVLKPGSNGNGSRAGLPGGEETPRVWMGVPLATLDKAFGCLAVFSYDEDVKFKEEAFNLLAILSGQVSVAIENVLMYKREQRRATQMENLNRISSLITASLDQEEVLSQVCQAVVQVGSGQRSAIFLLDPEKGVLFLARSSGLTDPFASDNASFPLSNPDRMRCLRSGRAVLVPDLAAYAEEPKYRQALSREGIRAFAEFPMITHDGRIGYLAAFYDSPHALRIDEVELLQTFASQAAVAVSNARLYAHTDLVMQRRANQVAILENVSRELSAAIDSPRLVDMILGYAMEFTSSISGEFSQYNQSAGSLEVKASRGYKNPRTTYPVSEGLRGKAVVSRRLVNIGDVRANREYLDLTAGKAISQLCIPVIYEDRVLGILSLESDRKDAYSSSDQAFISQIANQAAVSIVNADLYSSVQRKLREQSILYLVSQQLVINPEFDKVIQTLARSAEAYLETRAVGIYLWDENEQVYRSAAVTVASKSACQLPKEIPLSDLETIQAGLQKTGALRISPEKKVDLLFGCDACQALIFPIITRKQRLGMMLVHLETSAILDKDQLNLLRAMVSQAATSLHNALLFADVTISHDRLSAVLNSVGEGILMVDAGGRIMVANELIQAITGLPQKALLQQKLLDLPDTILAAFGCTPQEAEEIAANLSEGKVILPRKSMVHRIEKQSQRLLERSTSPVWGEAGRQTGWMALLRDVTEEQQIAQARELITSTLVHDLRSPLSAVISAVDILDENLPQEARDDVINQAFRVAQRGSTRVLGLIESLLDIARMQSGRMELICTPVNLHELVSGVVTELSSQAEEFGVILRNEVPEDLPVVDADQSKLVRVISNLIDNALKFSPAGGQVVIECCLDESGQVQVKISDEGPGIPEEYRERVFERFTQVPGQRSRRRGSGLGLTFCRMAVEAHGGKIWMENQKSPFTGSVFIFTL